MENSEEMVRDEQNEEKTSRRPWNCPTLVELTAKGTAAAGSNLNDATGTSPTSS